MRGARCLCVSAYMYNIVGLCVNVCMHSRVQGCVETSARLLINIWNNHLFCWIWYPKSIFIYLACFQHQERQDGLKQGRQDLSTKQLDIRTHLVFYTFWTFLSFKNISYVVCLFACILVCLFVLIEWKSRFGFYV